MADDEPLDDARQVAVAAAAAAARVVETVAREARDQAAQHRATLERTQDQRRAQETLAGLGVRFNGSDQQATAQRQWYDDLAAAQKWATPERLEDHHYDSTGCDSAEGRRGVDQQLITEWKAATQPYDSTERRNAADSVREAAGVSADTRRVRATADLMNGTDPGEAARDGVSNMKAGATIGQHTARTRMTARSHRAGR